MIAPGWRFELPPSLGREPVRTLAREFAALLFDAGFSTISPAQSYATLEERLLSGEADAAWGPPLVCARIEASGGAVALRAVRWGAHAYRSVLVVRADDKLDLKEAARLRRRLRAVWVDPYSMGGHVLPRAYLRGLGIDFERLFLWEAYLGSYERCLEEVLEGEADLTASFASAAKATRRVDGFHEMRPARAGELRALAYSAECPNDGIVVSPRLTQEARGALCGALRRLCSDAGACRMLARAFDVDGFDEPPPGSYRDLIKLV